MKSKKLVLVVVDSLKSEMLERAIETGRAPNFKALVEQGTYINDCVSTFPSLTPVASATIATGTTPNKHGIPSINWYSRGEERYVEYGTSWAATRRFGMIHVLYDTVYNMNLRHLSRSCPTIFETLEDMGFRSACTTFLVYRGRTRHKVSIEGGLKGKVVDVSAFRHATYGPKELYYGELFHSRETGCPDTFARPGTRDEFSGCVAEFLAQNDLFDFLLLSLPDNDHRSHRRGPHSTLSSIAWADINLGRLVEAAGGQDEFLERHAVILAADHSQSPVERAVSLADALSFWRLLLPNDPRPADAELAVCPGARSAMVYLLVEGDRARRELRKSVIKRLKQVDGVDLIIWMEESEARIWSFRGTVAFAPGRGVTDLRGRSWDIEGELGALDLTTTEDRMESRPYPDVLGRAWAATGCPGAGEIIISAKPGYEFTDWGGSNHVGGGSHGSLHRADSLGPLVLCGLSPEEGRDRKAWGLQDIEPLIANYFGDGE